MNIGLRIFIPLILLAACANPVAPSGGPVDETPPQIVESESTPNLQTNFDQHSFTLEFNEWVKLNNLRQQLIISPPVRYQPEVKLKGRTLDFAFDPRDTLQKNTTYSIQFGESIVDLNEGNAAQNLKFVFSTGPVIDSLSIAGQVKGVDDEFDVQGLRVMLYDRLEDSIPLKERPVYVSRTDKNGAFKLENLRADTFRIIAIRDENNNYMFDPRKESVAFLDSLIYLDQNIENLELTGFDEEEEPRLVGKSLQPDRARLSFNVPIEVGDLSVQGAEVAMMEYLEDSVIVWLEDPVDSLSLLLRQDNRTDTSIIKRSRVSQRDTQRIRLMKRLMNTDVTGPSDSLALPFNRSIVEIDTTLIRLTDTSTNRQFQIRTTNRRSVYVRSDWEPGMNYNLTLYPDALLAINGRSNLDTIVLNFTVPPTDKLGSITFTTDSLNVPPTRLIRLMRKEFVIEEFTIDQDRKPPTFVIPNLKPGQYEIVIIDDTNNNGKWDTGNYLELKQPEKRIRKELEPLRENWDLNVELQF
ncbi:MAG: Ig-like domain-containing protein [Saprospiraceae bacterium]|nr:Ig-like domain-containing protein [Saprospiraceae bacterium]